MSRRRPIAPILGCVAIAAALGIGGACAPIGLGNVSALVERGRLDVGFYPGGIVFLGNARLAVLGPLGTVFCDLVDGRWMTGTMALQGGEVLAIMSDRSTLAVCAPSGELSLRSSDTLEKQVVICRLAGTDYPRAAFSLDGRLLAVTNHRVNVDVWDVTTPTLVATLEGHSSNLFGFAFSPDGRTLATAGGKSGGTRQGSCIKVWDAATWTLLADLPTADIGDNHATSFAAGGARFLSGGNYRLVAWDTATWARVFETEPGCPCIYGMSISPTGELLALALDTGYVSLVDLATMRTLRNLRGPAEGVGAAFSPDGQWLATSFSDGSVALWTAP